MSDYNVNINKNVYAEEAVPYQGMLLMPGTNASPRRKAKLCTAHVKPMGYSFGTSKRNIDTTAQTNVDYAMGRLGEGDIFALCVEASNDALAYGDEVCVSAGSPGYIEKYAAQTNVWIIGFVCDSGMDANGGGSGKKVDVMVRWRYIPA